MLYLSKPQLAKAGARFLITRELLNGCQCGMPERHPHNISCPITTRLPSCFHDSKRATANPAPSRPVMRPEMRLDIRAW